VGIRLFSAFLPVSRLSIVGPPVPKNFSRGMKNPSRGEKFISRGEIFAALAVLPGVRGMGETVNAAFFSLFAQPIPSAAGFLATEEASRFSG
jgi:hypothetical protein